MVPVDPSGNLNDPKNWVPSKNFLGSPGADDGSSPPTAPAFLVEPVDTTVRVGERATFTALAYGVPDPAYQWQKDGADIPGAVGSSYTTEPVSLSDDGSRYRCVVTNSAGTAVSREVVLHVTVNAARFVRGDVNADGGVDVSDPVAVLRILFQGGNPTGCLDAADTNDSGGVDIADAVYLLNFLFGGGPKPPAPFPGCGDDPTSDGLTCSVFAPCE